MCGLYLCTRNGDVLYHFTFIQTKEPPKRSDYKTPSDKFVIELGSPGIGIIPSPGVNPATTCTPQPADSSENSFPPSPGDVQICAADTSMESSPDSNTCTSSESESGSEVPIQSEHNVSLHIHVHVCICVCVYVEYIFNVEEVHVMILFPQTITIFVDGDDEQKQTEPAACQVIL